MEKAETRRLIRRAIERIEPAQRIELSVAVMRNVLQLPEARSASVVMAYIALPDEVRTSSLIESRLAQGRTVCVPHTDIRRHRLAPVRLRKLDGLAEGALGIPEPEQREVVKPDEIEFVVTPGRAFDHKGNRLGRGGGYYDRFFREMCPQAFQCGVAFSCQVLEEIPQDEHDSPLDIIVTETLALRTNRGEAE